MAAGALFVAACSDSSSSTVPSSPADTGAPFGAGGAGADGADGTSGSAASGEGTSAPTGPAPAPLELVVPDPNSVYDPVRAGEELPLGFRQVLSRDAIAPVYDPTFVAADAVDWPADSLVIGVDLEGEARAYPVGFLNRREIVNDNHRGIPTLVTW